MVATMGLLRGLPVLLAAAAEAAPAAPRRHEAAVVRWREEPGRPFSEAAIAGALGLRERDVDLWSVRPQDAAAVAMLPAGTAETLRGGRNDELVLDRLVLEDVERTAAAQAANRRRWSSTAHNASASARGRRGLDSEFFDDYRELDAVLEYLAALALEHPLLARFIPSIGPSYEERNIPGIVIGGRDGGPAVYIQATSHAREWISTSTAMAFVVELLTSEDPELRLLVDELRFFIVPVLNPDGYVFTFSDDPAGRMWRKTRSPNAGDDCIGTDLNRNWNDHWGGEGLGGRFPTCASENPCSNSYRGDSVWSEPESAAVRDLLIEIQSGHDLLGVLDLHSFGQMFNRPYGWVPPDELTPPNDAATAECADRMIDAIGTPPQPPKPLREWSACC